MKEKKEKKQFSYFLSKVLYYLRKLAAVKKVLGRGCNKQIHLHAVSCHCSMRAVPVVTF